VTHRALDKVGDQHTKNPVTDSPDEIELRRVEGGEVALFRSVRLAALQDAPNAFGETLEDAVRSDWSARVNPAPDRVIYIAVADADPVGMVFAKCGTGPREAAFIGGMWVHPRYRRRGVGSRLLETAMSFLRLSAQERVALWVMAANADVLRFYESAGFRRTGATSTLRPGSDVPIVQLLRDLNQQ
jgi:ribosomal protein S18 acetylase RimI-like enzyme